MTDDLELTDETAAQIAGGDTAQVTTVSNVSQKRSETYQSSIAKL
jgi:hypothetical protein